MKIISIHPGHDASVAAYDTESKALVIIEIDKTVGRKHYDLKRVVDPVKISSVLIDALYNINQTNSTFPEEFRFYDALLVGGISGFLSPAVWNIIPKGSNNVQKIDHHTAHAMSAYITSPAPNAFLYTNDAGGDGVHGSARIFQNGFSTHIYNHTEKYVRKYTIVGHGSELYQSTLITDIAGKLMGLSAYGDPDTDLGRAAYYMVGGISGPFMEYKEKIGIPATAELFQDAAAGAQRGLEEALLNELNYNREYIEEQGHLCLAGGGAHNVIANMKVAESFDVDLHVNNIVDDGGLSVGQIAEYLRWQGIDLEQHKMDATYAGPKIRDADQVDNIIQERDCKEVAPDGIKKLLQDGKIVGLVQGNAEVGKRSLGRRSILADASYPDMNTMINKIKFREFYRPFAPVCRKENAAKYFEVNPRVSYRHMTVACRVKKDYQEKYSCITHVDGTARLQTIEEEHDPLLWHLCGDGVLLNTSFNVSGRPILNKAVDALWVLDNTELDHVVIEHKGKYWLF